MHLAKIDPRIPTMTRNRSKNRAKQQRRKRHRNATDNQAASVAKRVNAAKRRIAADMQILIDAFETLVADKIGPRIGKRAIRQKARQASRVTDNREYLENGERNPDYGKSFGPVKTKDLSRENTLFWITTIDSVEYVVCDLPADEIDKRGLDRYFKRTRSKLCRETLDSEYVYGMPYADLTDDAIGKIRKDLTKAAILGGYYNDAPVVAAMLPATYQEHVSILNSRTIDYDQDDNDNEHES